MKAIVLRRTVFGESDLVLRCLLESGEVRAFFAAGARKSLKRFPHRFDYAGIYEIDWRDSHGAERMQVLHRADLVEHSPEMAADLERWTRWLVLLEWLSYHEDGALDFQAIMQVRTHLIEDVVAAQEFHRFFLEQMRLHGLMPDWDQCVVCHSQIDGTRHFVMNLSGVAHPRCHPGVALSQGSLRFLKSSDVAHISEIDARQLDAITFPYLSQQLGRHLKSQSVFAQLSGQALPS